MPATEVKVGDCPAGGVVTGIRTSASGKSVWFTMFGANGEREWPRESTAARTMVFSRGNQAGSFAAAPRPGTQGWAASAAFEASLQMS